MIRYLRHYKVKHLPVPGWSPYIQMRLMGLVVAFCVGVAVPYVWTGGVSIAPTRERLDVRQGARDPADLREYLVDVNTASAAELVILPGVGMAMAESIVAEREANGPFQSLEDLQRVKGLGVKKIRQLRDFVMPLVPAEVLVEQVDDQKPHG